MARTGTTFREEPKSRVVGRSCDKIGLESNILGLTSVNGGIGTILREE